MKSIWRGMWLFGLPLALVLGVVVTLAQNGETRLQTETDQSGGGVVG